MSCLFPLLKIGITLANFNFSGKVAPSKEELMRYVSGLILCLINYCLTIEAGIKSHPALLFFSDLTVSVISYSRIYGMNILFIVSLT